MENDITKGIRRIFYDNRTGEKIRVVGRGPGIPVPPIDLDISTYEDLAERKRSTFDVVELEYTSFQQDFEASNGHFRINPETKTVEFMEVNPANPEEPIVLEKPLSEEIAELKRAQAEQDALIMGILFGGEF